MPMSMGKMKDKGDSGLLIALGGPEKSGMKSGAMGDMGGATGDESDESDEPESQERLKEIESMASDDAMAAIKADDSAAFQDALSRFVRACISEEHY